MPALISVGTISSFAGPSRASIAVRPWTPGWPPGQPRRGCGWSASWWPAGPAGRSRRPGRGQSTAAIA